MPTTAFVSWLLIVLTVISVGGQLLNGTCHDVIQCGQNGDCVQNNDTTKFWCKCDQGFGGAFCERECKLNCEPGMKCVVNRDTPAAEMCTCEDCELEEVKLANPENCPINRGGANCEVLVNANLDPCEYRPCLHGYCISHNNTYECSCNYGFWGAQCEHGTDNCQSNECYVTSRCVSTSQGYYCVCEPGRFGDFCEKTACTEVPGVCNQGACITHPPSTRNFSCSCPPGFEGDFCETDIDECKNVVLCGPGTCTNLPGYYDCDCPHGYTGKHCDWQINFCHFIKCENGGQCLLNPSTHDPFCRCRQGYMGEYCEIKCPEGFDGLHCNRTVGEPACVRRKRLCMNGGICMEGRCSCPVLYTGDNCERSAPRINITCDHNPCKNEGVCVPVSDSIGYVCHCPSEYTGDHCDVVKESCLDYPCANGGACYVLPSGVAGVKCVCPAGFLGPRCQIKENFTCDPFPCKNDGVCMFDGLNYKCDCKPGFTGRKCEMKTTLARVDDPLSQALCVQRGCIERAKNGRCDVECNLAACNFDGGDCTAGRIPFSKCKYNCASIFANKICNPECNNEDCLYDGMDCLSGVPKCPLRIMPECVNKFGDGHCDPQCNFEGCGYDGGDCNQFPKGALMKDIRVIISFTPLEFQEHGGAWLMNIGKTLRLAVRFQRDHKGPLIFSWNGTAAVKRVRMTNEGIKVPESSENQKSRQRARGAVVVYLEVQEYCDTDCMFSEANTIIDLLAAGLVRTNGSSSFGFPISQALIAPPPYQLPSRAARWAEGWTSWDGVYYFSFFAIFLGVVGMVGMRVNDYRRERGKRVIRAEIWMPPVGLAHSPPQKKGRRNPKAAAKEGDAEMALIQDDDKKEKKAKVKKPILLPPEKIPLHEQAADCGKITEVLTKESVRQIDSKYGRSVLHWLAANFTGKSEDDIPVEATRCINAGALVNGRDKEEMTPLMLAVRAKRTRLVVVLLRAGADPTLFNRSERNALHIAAANCDHRMMEILLTDQRLVKEIDQMDCNGRTALMIVAAKKGDHQVSLAKLLLSKGADVNENGKSRHESPIFHGRTALHFAAQIDNVEVVEYLISMNANVDQQDDSGQTAIMLAAKGGHEKSVKILVTSLASLIITDSYSRTAAQHATTNYFREIGDYLSEMSCNMNRNELVRQKHQQEAIRAKEPAKKPPTRTSKPAKTVVRSEEKPGPSNSTSLAQTTSYGNFGTVVQFNPQQAAPPQMTYWTPGAPYYFSSPSNFVTSSLPTISQSLYFLQAHNSETKFSVPQPPISPRKSATSD